MILIFESDDAAVTLQIFVIYFHIHSLEPGMIDTPMLRDFFKDVKLFSWLGIYRLLFMVSPDSFVNSALNTVGWTS